MKQSIILTITLCILGSLAVPGAAYAKADADALCKKIAAAPGDTALLKELKTYISKTTDVDQKARLAVIYCLGCLYTGQSKEAASVEAYLKKTFPTDPNMKYLSPQHLRAACQKCGGSGKMTAQCAKCRGSGKCTVCKGRGRRTVQTFSGSKTSKCTACGGSGKCRDCNGTGKSQRMCTACRGSGGALSRDKVKTTYLAILSPGGTPPSVAPQVPALSAPLIQTSTGPMSDSLRRSLELRRESLEKALANDEGYMALNSFVSYSKTEMKRKRPPPGSARSIPAGIDEYERQVQALIAQAEGEIARWKQLETLLGTHGYKFGESGRWPQQKLTDLSEARLKEIKTALSQEQARQAGARKTCLANLVNKIDSQLKDNKASADFTARVEAMYRKHHAERGASVGLDKVAFEPEKYRGKVLRSSVQIHHWDGFFAPLASTAVQHFLCTDALSKKCWKAYQAKGEYGMMKIKYVVGDDDKFYLLDITL